MSTTTKKELSEERLAKLAAARQKALEVRQQRAQKMNEIKTLEKQAKQKELDDKLAEVKKKVTPPSEPDVVATTKSKKSSKPPKKERATDVVKKIIQEESSDSSASESDDDDVTEPVKALYKNKYREKYKNKYQAKTLHQLTKGVAAQSLKTKVNDEIYKLAQRNLFGDI